MLLERRLVKILNDYNIYKDSINQKDFVDYILNKKWPRLNYYFYQKGDVFKRRVEITVADCIERKFIMNKDDLLRATKEGRDFIKFIGFAEEFLKRRKRTIVIPSSVILGAVAALLANYFLNK